MQIQEILTRIKITFKPDDKLSDALAGMNDFHNSCALVCEEGKLVGITTERDIVRHAAKDIHSSHPFNPTLEEFMTHRPITVGLETELSEAIFLVRSNNLRHLPVVDDNEMLIGVVTQSDMMNAWITLKEQNKELLEINQTLQWQALEDSLTGLMNRRAMEIDLTQTESLSRRHRQIYSVALLDIDFFKRYNDHYGHSAGDSVLQKVAKIMKNHIRDCDKMYRYGGEEFLYLMPETDYKGALKVCERLREALFKSDFEHSESPLGKITISIGTASTIGGDWEELVRQADLALYQAKRQGRNKVCLGQHFTDASDSRQAASA